MKQTARPQAKRDTRRLWYAAAGFVFLVTTFAAVKQGPRSDPYTVHAPKDLEWWLARPESNPELRLPYLPVRIRDVAASHDGKNIWAIGADDTVFESTDDGASWTQLQDTTAEIRWERDEDEGSAEAGK